jgi:hypothetical protein
VAEAEEHGQELVVDDVLREQLGIPPQVLSQHELRAPVVLSIIISFYDILDEPLPIVRSHLLQEHMQLLESAHPDLV